MAEFEMPPCGTWEVRGGWVVNALMQDLSLEDFQAAGIVGNIGFESIGFTKLHEIGQKENFGGYGWAQWTGPRRRSFLSWCEKRGLDWKSDEANYGYLIAELTGDDGAPDYTSSVRALRSCQTIDSAVFSIGQTYERPGGTTRTHLPGYSGRIAYARRALAGAGGANGENQVHPVLNWGSEGRDVEELQRRLKALGYNTGRVDGDFGAKTEAAVIAFQSKRKITIDGWVGNNTWNELSHAEAERKT